LQGKGIKAVLKKHAPTVLPRLTRLIVNPQVAAGGAGSMSSSIGAGDAAMELMGRNTR